MTTRILTFLLVISASLFWAQTDAVGYVPEKSGTHELKWHEWQGSTPSLVTLVLRTDTVPASTEHPLAEWTSAASQAIADWGNVRGSNIRFVMTTSTTSNPDNHCDGVNTIAFVNEDILGAVTTPQTRGECSVNGGDAYALYDADVRLTTRNITNWIPAYQNYESAPYDSPGSSFQAYLHHELGHVVGLDHQYNRLAALTPVYSVGGYGRLHGDDQAGARYLYPNSEVASDVAITNWEPSTVQQSQETRDACVTVPQFRQSVDPGNAASVGFGMENMGMRDENSEAATFYLSRDQSLDSDTYLYSQNTGGTLQVCSQTTNCYGSVSVFVTIPTGTKGTYYILTSLLPDDDISNNVVSMYQPITVNKVPPRRNNPSFPSSQRIHPTKHLTTILNGVFPDDYFVDDNGDPISCLGLSQALTNAGATINNCVFNWTPTLDQSLSFYTSHLTISDGDGGFLPQDFTVEVYNTAPTIASLPAQSVHPTGTNTVSFTVSSSDADGDILTYAPATNLPAGATFNTSTHVFSWTPPSNYALGTVSPTFTVSDGWTSTTRSVPIAVYNTAPAIAWMPTQSVHPGRTLTYAIPASDADGDALTCSMNPLLPGTVTWSGCTLNWTPPQTQPLGTVSTTVTATDHWTSVSQPLSIAVYNTPPSPNVTNQSTCIGGPLSFTVTGSDPDGDALSTYQASGTVFGMGATFNLSTHVFSWTPSSTGSYSATFSVNDPWTTGSQSITITVSSNCVPVMVLYPPGNQTTTVGRELYISARAYDLDGDSLTYYADLPPWMVWDSELHNAYGTPTQTGTYWAFFQAADPLNELGEEMIIITVTEALPHKPADKTIDEQ